MCGIAATIALPPAARANGSANGLNGHTNGVNGHANGVDGHANGINGHTNGINSHANGINGHANGVDGTHPANGYANGYANGVNGKHISNGNTSEALAKQLQAAVDIINHRGPDESGVWVSDDGSVGLGHCRLSINDLSPSGSQPLHSDDGQVHAIVNGEIYDYDRLREICAGEHGYTFGGHSDSELVLALYKIYGAPAMFEHLRGEFAFVLYDAREGSKRVIAGRDRFGIKPLVWTVSGDRLLLGAEAKSFLGMGWQPEWDVHAIADSGWMMDDRTLFKGVKKVLPGHWLELTEERGLETHRYWDAQYPDKKQVETRSIDEMVAGVRERLVEAVRLRLRADVPVGIYLSGGIDSSAVAGIVTELARKEHVKIGNKQATRVACFSVQFPEESGYNEADIADRTAKWLGVETVKKDVTEATLARDFADAAFHCEHHHFDLNSVAKFTLSELPRENGVKVVITGEGSDEHFAGYPYFPCEFLREPDLSRPDEPLAQDNEKREAMQKAASAEMNAIWRAIGAETYTGSGDNGILSEVNNNTMVNNLLAWHPTIGLFAPWVRDGYGGTLDCRRTVIASYPDDVRRNMQERWHPLHTAEYIWNKSQLANILLSCLGDRTEMAHSVEARTPFLDHHLAEYVNGLPPSVKLAFVPPEEESSTNGHAGTEPAHKNPLWQDAGSALRSLSAKWILREAMRPYITDELYRRKKHPFLAPTRWPRGGALHSMFESLLTPARVERLGFVDPDVVAKALDAAFGDKADTRAFRTLCYVGAWVTLSERLGVKTATA
ncbi:asparagine synthase [Durotheca rogersii]|uniref:asparagine synthase n=1 Tax=Durotheca rogersii TaxID=419775 RepID=UPI00221F2FA7|nr:asparagine synthase [Durotheca rogersii]KAI5867879.1 asparagine synthase [Durotheca rogersii]